MKLMYLFALIGLAGIWLLASCSPPASAGAANDSLNEKVDPMQLKQATFAAGCFWGVEAGFRHVPGVVSTVVGYTGGHTKNPNYKTVCTDTTGHAESVLVNYDPSKVSYAELLDAFWSSHDPTTVDRQGPDVGTQYRSVIFYHDAEQEKLAQESLKEVQDSGVFRDKIATEIVPAETFYPAEDYHQQYFEKQGLGPEACHVGPAVVHTKLAAQAAAARKNAPATQPQAFNETEAQLRSRLSPDVYEIARHAGTERAFTGKYWNDHRAGVYRCAVCGQALFYSNAKFESGTGWPSFYEPVSPDAVILRQDSSHGMVRTEVLCSRCKSHLGHLFDDGPAPTGQRYCMNSAVLDLLVDSKETANAK